MSRIVVCVFALFAAVAPLVAADAPLRIFIRSGPKTHGPGQHDHPRFLREWTALLNERGARATGGDAFPTAEQLAATDVLILNAPEAGNIPDAQDRANLDTFLKRGGGLVVIHGAAVSRDPDWYKTIVGGSWRFGTTKFLEAPMHLYLADRQHPVTRGASNWAMDDEIYYDLDMHPDAHVLATAYTPKSHDTGGRGDRAAQARAADAVANRKGVNIYDIQPQMWTYERTISGATKGYRAFVSIPGHVYENFNRPNYRAILLRGIAWAGQRANVDELCRPNELGDALMYPEGGPTHPLRAAAKLEVHPEFTVSLVAAEPLINKVMNLDWDERGRLWVCETPEYPNGRRAINAPAWKESGSLHRTVAQRDPEDRISILSDTNGDGIMDRKHVFADKLELVTSFVLTKNGVIAATAPDIWLLEDTNGDEVADKRTKLYTGLGIRDTHAVINNLRWGLDGWIYATHGYSAGEVTALGAGANAKPVQIGSGVVRFKPDGSHIEQYNSRNGNTWGLETTWDGQIFWTQPTSGTVFFHSLLSENMLAKAKMPGATSWKGMIVNQPAFPAMSWPEQAYVQIDQVGRFTAAAGCAIYEGGAWPDKWNYSYFTTECTLNIVHHQFVRPAGISYNVSREPGREQTEFIRSTDLWFRPIESRIGPDGALYLIDFYNQAVIHNDTRGPLHGPANAALRPDRDHYFGRIWRVQHKQAKPLPPANLDRRDLAGLQRTMETHPNAHVKKTAWRLVREEHGAAGRRALATLNKHIGSRAEARYSAARAATTPAARLEVLIEFIHAGDDWTRSALLAAATEHPASYLELALASPYAPALTTFGSVLAPTVAPEQLGTVLAALAGASNTREPLANAILRGLAAIDPRDASLEAAAVTATQKLLQREELMAATLAFAARWNRGGALDDAIATATGHAVRELESATVADARRADLLAALLRVPQSRSTAVDRAGTLLSDANTSDGLKAAVLAKLGELPGADTVDALVPAFVRTKSAAIFDQLLRRPESALALVAALQQGKVRAADLGPGNLARLRTHPNRQVANEASTVLAALSPETKAKDELIANLLPEVIRPGNVANGRVVFATSCAVCHKFDTLGTRDIGPPLSGIGAHGPAELLAHIVDPNRQVEPNYVQWDVTKKNGETLVGVIVNENASTLTLRHVGGDMEVRKDEIATRQNTGRSLMFEGFENLGAPALRDLIAFMVASSTKPAPTSSATPAPAPAEPATAAVEGPKEGGKNDAPLPATQPIAWRGGKTKVLIVTGGSSHKFGEFFATMDRATLEGAGFEVHVTEDRDQAAAELAHADVAVISVNRMFFDTPAYRRAVLAFAESGKGLVMLHPGTWYAFPNWPELNAKIVGGGAQGHDKLGPYTVNVTKSDHPVMRGVPASFEVVDELYYVNAEPEKIPPGTVPIVVLAESSPSQKFKRPHPVVWITQHEKARIVGLTLGHDERTHSHAAFKALLANAVQWAARETSAR